MTGATTGASLPPRSRGVIGLLEENCTVCMLCARECPDWCIYIESHKETVPPPAVPGAGAVPGEGPGTAVGPTGAAGAAPDGSAVAGEGRAPGGRPVPGRGLAPDGGGAPGGGVAPDGGAEVGGGPAPGRGRASAGGVAPDGGAGHGGGPAPGGHGVTPGRARVRNVLDRFAIDFSLCMYCGICVEVCPYDALFWSPEYAYPEAGIAGLTHERDRLREWMWTVPPPPAHDPGAPVPREVPPGGREPGPV